MEHLFYYLDGEQGLKEHRLDCCFFASQSPASLEAIELWEDPYYLVVPQDSDLADRKEVDLAEIAGKYPFIPTTESFDEGSIRLTTHRGGLEIQGEGLHIEKLSLDGGDLRVEGLVTALIYDTGESERGGGLLRRLLGGSR